MSSVPPPVTDVRELFERHFGDARDVRVASAPGRVNLIGEHTDYNDGSVLPIAIDRHIAVAFRPRSDATLRVAAAADDRSVTIQLAGIEPGRHAGWEGYVAGVAWALRRSGMGLSGADLAILGNVPVGAGLASSAALELAAAVALAETAGATWTGERLALLAHEAESQFVGVRCGVMDQFAAAVSVAGAAMLLDCRRLAWRAVPIPDGVAVVVMDTGVRRALATSEYNARRESCELALRAIREDVPSPIAALRDVDEALLEQSRHRLDAVTYRRARHVVREMRRPESFAAALTSGDFAGAGAVLNASHQSLRDDYQVSSPELERITRLARAHPACYGARLTGAGFGGCALALVDSGGAETFARDIGFKYRAGGGPPGQVFVVHPVGGVHLAGDQAPQQPQEAEERRSC